MHDSLSPTFLNLRTTNETFQQSGKHDSLKSSARMYESSGSQFFRTTSGIQSVPDAFVSYRNIVQFQWHNLKKVIFHQLIAAKEGL